MFCLMSFLFLVCDIIYILFCDLLANFICGLVQGYTFFFANLKGSRYDRVGHYLVGFVEQRNFGQIE